MTFDWTVSIPVLISVAAMVFTWFRTRRQDVDERFGAGTKRMDGLDRRLSSVEQAMQSLPATTELHRLELALADMAGDMKAMAASQRNTSETLRRLDTILSRHEDHLLGQARK